MRIELEQDPGIVLSTETADTTTVSTPPKRSSTPETKLLSVSRVEGGLYRARFVDLSMRTLDAGKLRAEIAGLHTPGHPPAIIMSMRNMDSLTPSCLRAFTQLSTDLQRVGGVLVLYNMPKHIAKLIKKTKLDRVITVAKARPQATKRAIAVQKKHTQSSRMRAA